MVCKSLNTQIAYFYGKNRGIILGWDKQDATLEKQDSTVRELKEFKEQTGNGLQDIKTDYGKFSVYMERIIDSMEKDRKDFRDAIEKLAKAIVDSKK